jgi:hypothetical protein
MRAIGVLAGTSQVPTIERIQFDAVVIWWRHAARTRGRGCATRSPAPPQCRPPSSRFHVRLPARRPPPSRLPPIRHGFWIAFALSCGPPLQPSHRRELRRLDPTIHLLPRPQASRRSGRA